MDNYLKQEWQQPPSPHAIVMPARVVGNYSSTIPEGSRVPFPLELKGVFVSHLPGSKQVRFGPKYFQREEEISG